MIAIVRIIIASFLSLLICIFGCIYCLFSPRNTKHTAIFGKLFGKLSYIFGITVISRIPYDTSKYGPSIYIGNHQNYFDIITISNGIQKNTVTVGKKSLLFIPFFGQLYWLSGNILINRNKTKSSMLEIVNHIKKKKSSILIFPEGTRNHGKKLLPFKIGAFYAAIVAKVPIIPICLSKTEGKIKLNSWNNGKIILEILPPINTKKYESKNSYELAEYCHKLIKKKINEINKETETLELKK